MQRRRPEGNGIPGQQPTSAKHRQEHRGINLCAIFVKSGIHEAKMGGREMLLDLFTESILIPHSEEPQAISGTLTYLYLEFKT